MPLLVAVLADTEGPKIQERVFNQHFARYLAELLSPTITWRELVTITGAKCDFSFALDANSRVVPIPGWHYAPQLAGQLLDFDHCWLTRSDAIALVTQETVSRRPLPSSWTASRRNQALEHSLRLVKPGTPRLHAHATVQVSKFPLWQPIAFCFDWGPAKLGEPEVIIERRDARQVKRLWQADIHNPNDALRPEPRLELAQSRFFSSYGQGWWMDHILDLTIAIEALVSPADEKELSYRLAARAALLLGKKGEADPDVYIIVKTMYDARSKTVHGTPVDEKDHGKWLSKISRRPYQWPDSILNVIAPAIDQARSVVRSLVIGCRRLAESTVNPPGIRWPLPDDFEYQMMDAIKRRTWQKCFPSRLVTPEETSDS